MGRPETERGLGGGGMGLPLGDLGGSVFSGAGAAVP